MHRSIGLVEILPRVQFYTVFVHVAASQRHWTQAIPFTMCFAPSDLGSKRPMHLSVLDLFTNTKVNSLAMKFQFEFFEFSLILCSTFCFYFILFSLLFVFCSIFYLGNTPMVYYCIKSLRNFILLFLFLFLPIWNNKFYVILNRRFYQISVNGRK